MLLNWRLRNSKIRDRKDLAPRLSPTPSVSKSEIQNLKSLQFLSTDVGLAQGYAGIVRRDFDMAVDLEAAA